MNGLLWLRLRWGKVVHLAISFLKPILRVDNFLTSSVWRLSEHLVKVNNLKLLFSLSLRFANSNFLLCFGRQISWGCLAEYIFTVITIIGIIMFTIFLFISFLILCWSCTMSWSRALLCNCLYWSRKIDRFRRWLSYWHRYLNLDPTYAVIRWYGYFLFWRSFIFIRYV